MAEALRGTGLEVVERDVDAGLLAALRAEPPACVVPMLHGETGEDGAIREVLELLGVPVRRRAARPPAAPRSTSRSPRPWPPRAGIRTPESVCLPHETFRELGRRRGDGGAGGPARACR